MSLLDEDEYRSEKRRRIEITENTDEYRGNKLYSLYHLDSVDLTSSTSTSMIQSPSSSNIPRIVKPLPLRPFNRSIRLPSTSSNNNSNTIKLPNEMIKTNAEVLECEVEMEEMNRFNLERETGIKARQALMEFRDDIIFNTSYLILTDKTGSNYTQVEPFSTRFDSINGCFEWILPLELSYYLVIIPLSHLSFIAFSSTGVTMTLIEQPQLFSKPIQNPLNLTWSPISSLPSFNPYNYEEVFHYLEITSAQETKIAFWNLREKFPLVKNLIDVASMESQETSRFTSTLNTTDKIQKYSYAQELKPFQQFQNQSQFSQFYQPTPPPSPCPSSFFLPPVSSSHLYYNYSNLPLPTYPDSTYRFPLPPPISSSTTNTIEIDYPNQLTSPPSSAMAMNCFDTEQGIGLGLDLGLGLIKENKGKEETWWWG